MDVLSQDRECPNQLSRWDHQQRYFKSVQREHIYGSPVCKPTDPMMIKWAIKQMNEVVRSKERLRFYVNAVDMMAIKANRPKALGNNGSISDKQTIKTLLGICGNQVSRLEQVFFTVFPFVVFNTVILIAASLKD